METLYEWLIVGALFVFCQIGIILYGLWRRRVEYRRELSLLPLQEGDEYKNNISDN